MLHFLIKLALDIQKKLNAQFFSDFHLRFCLQFKQRENLVKQNSVCPKAQPGLEKTIFTTDNNRFFYFYILRFLHPHMFYSNYYVQYNNRKSLTLSYSILESTSVYRVVLYVPRKEENAIKKISHFSYSSYAAG